MSLPTDHPVFPFAVAMVDRVLELSPEWSTFLGIPGRDHRWSDYTPAGVDAVLGEYRRLRQELRALPEHGDDRWADLAIRVIERFLSDAIDDIEHEDHLRDLNNIASPFQEMRDIFDMMRTDSPEAWANIARRLETIDEALGGYRASLEEGRTSGMAVARRQVEAAIEQGVTHSGDGSFFVMLADQAAESDIDDDLLERVAAGCDHARAAYAAMTEYLRDTYLPSALDEDAVGSARYVRAARQFLGMTIDPKETYAWGWEEIARLRARMIEVAEEISPGASIDEAMSILKTDPERGIEGVEAFRRFIAERQDIALRDLEGRFDIPDEIREVDVKIAPPGGALGAYYTDPSEDFERPGAVWWSIGDKTFFPLYDEVSTAYHEGFPGHHLQVGYHATLADRLSRAHRLLVWYPGFGEGWALYAEQVMDEFGYLEKPDYVMGFLAGQMLRACRVVIDIGSHLGFPIPDDAPIRPGQDWSFEAGVQLLMEYATLDKAYAESEMTRYLGWPGQAIAYKVGQKVINDLRDELRSRRGDGFSLNDFHGEVLAYGPVGLDLLVELVLENG